jgi:MHS family proline/betaine transporter-like MFS transporter
MYAILLIFFGILCDKVGARKVFNFSCVLFILFSFPAFALFNDNNFASIYFCYTFVAIAIAAASASGILLLAESYPAKVRYSGSSLSYNIAFGIFAGFTPLIVTTLIQKTELKTAPAFYMIAVSVVALFFSVLKDHKVHE